VTDLDSLLREADEHDRAAIDGPWGIHKTDNVDVRKFYADSHHRMALASCTGNADFIAWSRTAVPKLAAAVRELRERQQKIQAFVDAQSNDPALWCEAVHISEAYLQQALRKLHACIDGEDISWLEHGD
jgi:hypothetical protein